MLTLLRRFGIVAALALVAGIVALPQARSGELAAHNVITPNRAELAFGSISGTTAGTANTVLTTTVPSVQIGFENTTDVQLIITRGGVDFKRVPAGGYRVLDLKADSVAVAATVWGVYRASGAPASGVIEVLAMPAR